MMPADTHWLRKVLAGEKVKATFRYGVGNVLLSHEFS